MQEKIVSETEKNLFLRKGEKRGLGKRTTFPKKLSLIGSKEEGFFCKKGCEKRIYKNPLFFTKIEEALFLSLFPCSHCFKKGPSEAVFLFPIKTLLGVMLAASEKKSLLLLGFLDQVGLAKSLKKIQESLKLPFFPKKTAPIRSIEKELSLYFTKKISHFKTPFLLLGSPFQRKVWESLQKIPYGKTLSYGQLAQEIHNPKAFRAVATANKHNLLSIMIPCHRVIQAKGNLGGYAGGLLRKKKLLSMETFRCFGNKAGQEEYAEYHDTQWGRPIYEDIPLFEMLILEGAQAGLSWETILKRRAKYREVFHKFDPRKVANMEDSALEKLKQEKGIIRNHRKIFSVRQNAKVFLKIQKEFGSFSSYIWAFIEDKPVINYWEAPEKVPASSSTSMVISKDLKKRGMLFVGSTIIYAYMQAVGMVDDHLLCCPCHTKNRTF